MSGLKGFIQGIEVRTGSGQKLMLIDKHLWAYA